MKPEECMKRAIELAENGVGFVNPNPLVGAVIVRDGRIIGEGWHARYGEAHAERNALANCTESPVGAELFVTLEPCCHEGKQPPCTDAIIQTLEMPAWMMASRRAFPRSGSAAWIRIRLWQGRALPCWKRRG